MYVCLCNGFTEGDLRRLAAGRKLRVAEVYRHFGERGCGRCVEHIRSVLGEVAAGPDRPRTHAGGGERFNSATAAVV